MSEAPIAPHNRRAQQRDLSTGIGARVSDWRREEGLRVADLAGVVGVSPSLISQIERGRTPICGDAVHARQGAFGPVDDLFEEAGSSGISDVPPAPAPRGQAHVWTGRQNGPSPRPTDLEQWPDVPRPKKHRATLDIRGGIQWERLTSSTLDNVEFLDCLRHQG